MRLSALLLTTSLFSLTAAAHADTFNYDFSNPTYSLFFTYSSPELVVADTYIHASTCTWYTNSCSVELIPTLGEIQVTSSQGGGILFYLLPPEFFTVGTHVASNGTSTLTISVGPTPPAPVSPVPEPSSIALLGTGLLGVVGAIRRRFSV